MSETKRRFFKENPVFFGSVNCIMSKRRRELTNREIFKYYFTLVVITLILTASIVLLVVWNNNLFSFANGQTYTDLSVKCANDEHKHLSGKTYELYAHMGEPYYFAGKTEAKEWTRVYYPSDRLQMNVEVKNSSGDSWHVVLNNRGKTEIVIEGKECIKENQTVTDSVSVTVSEPKRPETDQENLSDSKLGIFLLGNYSGYSQRLVNSGNLKVLKVMNPWEKPEQIKAVREFKAKNPEGITVLRIWVDPVKFYPDRSGNYGQPEAFAGEMFNSAIVPALEILKSDNSLRLFDYVEMTNEFDNSPILDSYNQVVWHNAFWVELISRLESYNQINNTDLNSCSFNYPVGHPGDGITTISQKIKILAPAIELTKETGGAFCYHGYTIDYSTNLAKEKETSLKYRQIQQSINKTNPEIGKIDFLITETGVDFNGDRHSSGWRARTPGVLPGGEHTWQQKGRSQDLINWLDWYNHHLTEDQVLGAAIFQSGDIHGWSSFNIEDEEVTQYLAGEDK